MSAEFYQILGNPQISIDIYNQQLSEKQDYTLLVQRAVAYITLNDISNAKKDLKDAINLDQQRFEAFYQQGICDFHDASFFSSKEYLLKSLKIVKDNDKLSFFKDSIQTWLRKCEAEISRNRPQQEKNENQKITYSWFQTDNKIKIQFPQSVNSKDDVKYNFQEKNVEFSIKSDNNTNIEYNFELFDQIIPEESQVELNLQKIELQLMKKEKNKNWPKLNAEHIFEEPKTYNPSSSKVKRDWDKIEKDLEKEMMKEGDPLNEMFKQIYSNGDEETRKAMIKSFQTSGGTVLSTNWGEVASKDYENKDRPAAPEGQKWEKW